MLQSSAREVAVISHMTMLSLSVGNVAIGHAKKKKKTLHLLTILMRYVLLNFNYNSKLLLVMFLISLPSSVLLYSYKCESIQLKIYQKKSTHFRIICE